MESRKRQRVSDSVAPPVVSANKGRTSTTDEHEIAPEGVLEYMDDGNEDSIDFNALPCDTLAAVQYLHQELYNSDVKSVCTPGQQRKRRIGLVLKHQIYTVLENRTTVDRELSALIQSNAVRLFHLPGAGDEHGVLQTDDYIRLATNALARSPPECLEVLRALLNKHKAMHILGKDVDAALHDTCAPNDTTTYTQQEDETGEKDEGKSQNIPEDTNINLLKDRVLKALVKAGLLLPHRDIRQGQAYWFSTPLTGTLLASLQKGRTALLQSLKRKRYGETRLNHTEIFKTLGGSKLGSKFHVRDLQGQELIKIVKTPGGDFIKIIPQK